MRFHGPPVRVRRGPRPAVVLVTLLLAGLVAVAGRWWMSSPAFGPPAGLEEAAAPARRPAAGRPAVRELRLHRHAARRRRTRRVQPVPADPLRRATGRRARRRRGARPDRGRPGVRRDRAAVRGGRRHRRRRPARTGEAYQPDLYGHRWAPVLVAWSTAAESPELARRGRRDRRVRLRDPRRPVGLRHRLRHARQRGRRRARRPARPPGRPRSASSPTSSPTWSGSTTSTTRPSSCTRPRA